MGSTDVEREIAEKKVVIEELEKDIKAQQSAYDAAPESSDAKHIAGVREGRLAAQLERAEQRLATQLERAEQRLAALQMQLTPPAGAPCSVSDSISSTRWPDPLHCFLSIVKE